MTRRDRPPQWVHHDGRPYDELDRGHTRWVDESDLDARRPRLRDLLERLARRLPRRR